MCIRDRGHSVASRRRSQHHRVHRRKNAPVARTTKSGRLPSGVRSSGQSSRAPVGVLGNSAARFLTSALRKIVLGEGPGENSGPTLLVSARPAEHLPGLALISALPQAVTHGPRSRQAVSYTHLTL